MKLIQKALQVNTRDFFEKHLYIINPFLPIQLTQMEIKVLAGFMALEGELVESNRFNSTARKVVMERLGLQPGGLSNYLRSLINKGALIKKEPANLIYINKALLPLQNDVQGYQFKLVRNET